MKNKKGNTGIVVLVTLLFVVVIAMTVYIAYDKLHVKDNGDVSGGNQNNEQQKDDEVVAGNQDNVQNGQEKDKEKEYVVNDGNVNENTNIPDNIQVEVKENKNIVVDAIELENAVKNTLIQKIANEIDSTKADKVAEGHKILGYEVKDGQIYTYVAARIAKYDLDRTGIPYVYVEKVDSNNLYVLVYDVDSNGKIEFSRYTKEKAENLPTETMRDVMIMYNGYNLSVQSQINEYLGIKEDGAYGRKLNDYENNYFNAIIAANNLVEYEYSLEWRYICS